jgi:uncharacterized protein YbbC (DUF1343 family)
MIHHSKVKSLSRPALQASQANSAEAGFYHDKIVRHDSPARHALSFATCVKMLALFTLYLLPFTLNAQRVIPGAEHLSEYLPMLQGKRVAVLMNQTSRVGNALLADTLQKQGVKLVKIFVPEHGFRGTASAGAHINNSFDTATGLPVISLYGDNKKPKALQLQDVDVVIYDLQDVGVRFFTYISTLEYLMEACAENNKKLIILDRPNPNGAYVDGPVLDIGLKSFVGMQRIPILYGMTPGEYAQMLKGEGWFNKSKQLDIRVIKCKNWNHRTAYNLPVPPSPNLRTANAIALYPSLCLFEGTVISLGRGTNRPFEQWGHPSFAGKAKDSFRPASIPGAKNPPLEGKTCYGMLLDKRADEHAAFELKWLRMAYSWYPQKEKFFNNFFEKLAGTTALRNQIERGVSEDAIRKSWQPGIAAFKKIRKNYLLYADFE